MTLPVAVITHVMVCVTYCDGRDVMKCVCLCKVMVVTSLQRERLATKVVFMSVSCFVTFSLFCCFILFILFFHIYFCHFHSVLLLPIYLFYSFYVCLHNDLLSSLSFDYTTSYFIYFILSVFVFIIIYFCHFHSVLLLHIIYFYSFQWVSS